MTKPYVFEYTIPQRLELTMPLIRKTLQAVKDELLTHGINGGGKKLQMNAVCVDKSCGMAACIGGWASIFLLGFEKSKSDEVNVAFLGTWSENGIVDNLFEALLNTARENGDHRGLLSQMFYDYKLTKNYNEPNVAATAIHRYLKGLVPWPDGTMPNVLPYTELEKPAVAKKRVAAKKK